jgi:hypothetical protein
LTLSHPEWQQYVFELTDETIYWPTDGLTKFRVTITASGPGGRDTLAEYEIPYVWIFDNDNEDYPASEESLYTDEDDMDVDEPADGEDVPGEDEENDTEEV